MNIETDYTKNMVCPYCGHKMLDSLEYFEDDDIAECDDCGKEFAYTRYVEAHYYTKKIGE